MQLALGPYRNITSQIKDWPIYSHLVLLKYINNTHYKKDNDSFLGYLQLAYMWHILTYMAYWHSTHWCALVLNMKPFCDSNNHNNNNTPSLSLCVACFHPFSFFILFWNSHVISTLICLSPKYFRNIFQLHHKEWITGKVAITDFTNNMNKIDVTWCFPFFIFS